MKRFLRFLALVALMCVPWVTQAQTTVEIGDGTATSNQVPFSTYYNYSISEMLYTADEIGTAGTISSISFYWTWTAEKEYTIDVYMMNADAADLSTGISLADADAVFSGTISLPATAGWVTINLGNPFTYDGVSNLLIGVNKTAGSNWFSGQSWQGTSVSNMARYSQSDNNAYGVSTVPGSAASVRPNIQIAITPSGGPTCEKPSAIGVYSITPNTAVVQWESDVENYILEYKTASESEWTVISGLTSNIYTLESLLPLTSYSVRVKAVCGTDLESGYKTTSFTTPAGIPLIEAFATSSVPTGWSRYTGLLSDVQGGAALSTTTSGWNFNTGNGVFDNHAKVNIYGTNCKYWLVTPSLTMQDNVQLTFDLALTVYTSTSSDSPTPGDQADDKFVVLISTDNMATWEVLRQWDNEGSEYVYDEITNNAAGQNVAIDLSDYAGQSVCIAFYGESTVQGGDNNLHIDNIRIDYIPDCAIPTSLAYSDVTAHGVTLNWNPEGGDYWQLSVNDATEMTGGVYNTTTPTYSFINLAPETQYKMKVRSVCGGFYSEWTNNVIFTTGIACLMPTSVTVTPSNYTAQVSWTENGDADEWVVAYKTSSATDFEEVEVTENPYTLTGLTPETGYVVKVKAVCGGIDGESQWTNNKSFTTLVACPAPTNMAAQYTPGDGSVATLSWTEAGEATDWVLEYGNASDFTDATSVDVSGTPSLDLTELTPEATYYARVKAICDEESDWSSTLTFNPTVKTVIGSGTSTSNFLPANNFYKYSLTEQIYTAEELGEAGAIFSIDFYKASTTEMVKDLDIYIVSTDKSGFESTSDWITVSASDLVYSGTVTFGNNEWTTISLDNPFMYDGESNIAIVVDNNTGAYKSNTPFRVFTAEGNQAIYYQNDNTNLDPTTALTQAASGVTGVKNQIRVLIGEPPACAKPAGLAVNYEGGTEATISWSSDAEEWNMRVNGEDVNATITNPYTLTGLDLATTYSVEVQAVCGNTESEWTSAVSFTTDRCADPCVLTIVLTDSYGDGWNGNNMNVVDAATEEVLQTYTLTSGNSEGTFTLAVCTGDNINFVYGINGSSSYPTENGWVITDNNDEVIAEHEGCNSGCQVAAGVLANYTANCAPVTCQKPTELAVVAESVTAHEATISWTANGDEENWQIMVNGDEENLIEVSENPYTMTELLQGTEYTVKVRAYCDDEDQSRWSDAVSFTTLISCAAPTELTATESTANTVTISWTAGGDETEWNVYLGEELLGSVDENTYTFEGLEASSTYTVGVSALCDEESSIATITVNTACGAVDAPYAVDFEDADLLSCWTFIDADGDGYNWGLAEHAPGSEYPAHSGSMLISSASYDNNTGALTPDNWLITPAINLPSDVNMQLSWWERGQDPSWCAETYSVYVSTTGNTVDDFNTEEDAPMYTATGDWVNHIINLSDYSGQTVYIAFRHYDVSDVFILNIDDISIEEAPACGVPTDITVDSWTATSVNISWTDNNDGNATYAVFDADDNEITTVENASATGITVTGLQAETYYNLTVKAVCSETETSAAGIVPTFYTGYCQPTPGAINGNGITEVTFGAISVTNTEYPTASPYYGNYSALAGIVYPGTTANVDITFETGTSYQTLIWVDWDNSLSFEDDEIVYSGSSASDNPTTLNATFDIDAEQELGDYRMRIGASESYLSSNANPCYTGNWPLVYHDYTLRVAEEPECMPVTDVEAVYEGGSIATVTWTSEADSWNIDVNGEVIEDVTSPYELSELEFGTVYNIKVQAICGENESFWSNPVSFTTDLCAPENQCDIAIVLTDAYGDGWNGNSMNVVDVNTESVLGTYTLASGSEETFTLAICDGREINFVYVQGSGSTYPYENGWTITDTYNELLSQHEGCSSSSDCEAPTAGVVLSHVGSCTPPECVIPTGLTVSDVTAHTATVSFESEASAWQYRLNNDDETIADVPELPFMLEELDATTDYSIEVRAVCGNNYSSWTEAVDFTTLESCPAVTNITVSNVTTTSARLTWQNPNHTDGTTYTFMDGDLAMAENVTAIADEEEGYYYYDLGALEAVHIYNVSIIANCGEEGSSVSASAPQFITPEGCPDGLICIGTGESTNNELPASNYYNYSLTEQIYTAEELGEAGAIMSIDFYKASTTEMVKDLDIYIVSTDKSEFESTTDWITVSASDLVYSGTVTFGDNEWTTISLDSPFIYDGESNIAIVVDNNTGSYKSNTPFRVFATAGNQAIYYRNDNTNLDPTTALTQTATGIAGVKNRIRVLIGEPPSCLKPTGVTVNNIGTTTADLTWDNNNGADATYTVKNGDVVLTTEAVDGYTLTGLTPAQTYAAGTFTIISNCDETAVANVPAFVTACEVIAAEGYAENFDEYTVASNYTAPTPRVLPTCWNAINTTTYSSYATLPSVFYNSSTNYANSTPNSLKFYSYYSSYSNYDPQDQYAILPEMEGLAGKQITLQARGYNTTSTFKVGVMTDPTDASTFVPIATQDGLTTSYQEFEYFIPTDAEGSYVAIMIEAANSSRTTNGVYIDDITINNPPACIKPTYLAATLIPAVGDKAILNWTENGDATAWEICLNGDEDNLIEVTENPYTLTDLTAEEIYTAKVRANCGDNGTSDWSNEVTFNPTNKIVIGEGTTTSSYVPTQTNYDYSLTNQIYTAEEFGEAGAILSVDFFMTGSSNYTRNLDVYMVSTDKTGFEDGTDWISVTEDDLVFSGDVDFVAGDWTTITFTNPFVYDGINNVAIIVDDNTGSYSSRSFRVFSADGYQALYKYQDNNDIPVTYDGSGTRLSSKNQIRILKGEPPTCYKPTAVEATELTAEGATITWTRDERNAEGETYSILDENHEPVAEAEELTGDNFQLTGLEAAHEYTYYVLTNCANDEEVNLVAVTFTTLADCPAPTEVAVVENSVNAYNATISWTGYPANENGYLVSYRTAAYFDGVSEQFATTSAPTGWTRYSGLLSDVMNGTQLTTTTSGWTFGTGNNVFDNHAKVNIYGTGSKYWLVTPDIDVTEGYVLNFDMALTVWSSSSSASPTAGNQPDDKFVVLVSGDEMATWTILRQWDNEGSEYVYDDIPNTGENVSIDLSDFVGQTVNIAFYGESTTSNGDNNLHIDNVAVGFDVAAGDWETVNTDAEETTVELTNLDPETMYEVKVQGLCANDVVSEESESITFTTLPSCVPVTDVQVNNITSNSVDVSWTVGLVTDNAWQIAYRENGANEWNETLVDANPYTLGDLAANTAYELRVRTFCGTDEQSDWSNTVSFTTECDAFAIPYATGFESSDPTLSCWSMVDVASSTGFASDCFKFAYNYNPPQYLISPRLTGTENGVQVEFDYKAGGNYAESFMVGYSTTTSEPDAFTWGEELTGITSTTYQRYYEIIPEAGVKYICIKYTANDMLALYIDNFDVKEIEEFNVEVAVSTASGEPLGTVTSEPTDLNGLHYNDEVSLTANTDVTGYEFKGWYNNDDEGAFITDENPYTFNVTSDRYILAAFGLIQYTVSVSADENGTAYIIDPETSEPVTSVTADYNSELTLVAEANTCYEFVNWTLNGDPVSTDASFTINVLDNNAYVANFTEKSYTSEETVTACDNYEWNGTVYEESTIVDVTLESVEGCDSVATLNLTINNSSEGVEITTVCDSYEWIDGETYTESTNEAQFTLEGGNAYGCDSVVTLNLTVNYSSTGIDEQVACDSYEWMDGETYTESTNEAQFTLEGANAYGCDSLVTLNLTVNNSTTGIDEQTACDSYTWIDGIEYTASNNEAQFTLEGANAYGCDSVVTLNLTINNSTTGIDVQTACDTYTWIDGNIYTENNSTAQFTLTNAAGCDSVVTLNFTVRRSTAYTDVQIACDEFEWIDGETYTESNNEATFTTTNAAGCDSVITLNLTVNYSSEGVVEETACNSFVWHGTNYTESTEDTYESVNAAGCDSVTTLYLTINHCATTTVTACDSYIWSITGQTYTESNTYIDGNDTLILTINHSNTGIETVTACDRYDWFEHTNLTVSSNDLTHEFTNVEGCDSIVTLNLTVNYSNTGVDVQTACDTYTWIDGETYTANNTVAQYTLENAAGCDSVVTLNLTVNYSNTGVDEQVACDEFEWIDGNVYTESNNEAQFTLTNAAGCDSVVTLNLTVNYSNTGVDEQIACDEFEWIDGNVYTESNNEAQFTLTNIAGCDSVVTLNLTVNYSNTGVDEQIACDEFEWIDGNVYTESNNEAQFTIENIAGCDSVVTLNLTVNYSNTGVDEQIACDEFEWIDGNVYTESTNEAQFTLENIAGCDSVVTLNLTVNYSTTYTDEQIACDEFEWIDGETYTESNNTATFTTTNVSGCDSVITLNLTVNYSNTGVDEQIACDEFEWIDGIEYTASNNEATFTLVNAAGCDSVVTLNLTINHSNTGVDVQTACESYTWIDGETYTESNNTATFTLTNAAGCDSVVTLNLTVNYSNSEEVVMTITENQLPYTFMNIVFEAGVVNEPIAAGTNVNGCDSTVIFTLIVNMNGQTNDFRTICDNELPYTWNGVEFTEAGMQSVTLEDIYGADSVVNMYLTVNYGTHTTQNVDVCDEYLWNGVTYTESDTYVYEYNNVDGCASDSTLNLTIRVKTTSVDEQIACDSYTWIDGNVYTESNNEATFTMEGANAAGCDSVVTLNLTVNYSNTGVDEQIACDSFEWIDGNVYTESNNTATFTLEGANVAGCDSVVTLNLTINHSNTGVDEQIACDEFEWIDGNVYTESNNTATFTLTNIAGCDSVVTLNLTINYSTESTVEETINENELPYTFNGEVFDGAETRDVVINNIAGCDSTIHFTLNVNWNSENTDEMTICASQLPYTWNGVVFETAGTKRAVLESVTGADSVVIMTLNVYPITDSEFSAEACVSYTWNDTPYAESGDYEQSFTDQYGCDSVVTMHLTINNVPINVVDEQIACDSYEWIDGNVYTESNNTATFTETSVDGCDSIITLNLTINYSTESELSATILQNQLPYTWNDQVFEGAESRDVVIENLAGCDSTIHYTLNVIWNSENTDEMGICASQLPYTWNGVVFEAAGTKPVTLQSITGADSVVIMTLNVYPEDNTEFSEAACESYVWNNTLYTESGNYVAYLTNQYGCDSTVTLHLTINTPVNVAYTEEACEVYTWNGTEYTESGDYTFAHEDVNGCNQVDTLHLTINNPVHLAYTEAACESYTWYNTEYTESGDYTFAHTDVHGCNQVDTLHLTINNPVHVAYTEEACEVYTWNNTNYTVSGDYTFAHTDDNGCNQVDTLHLTIYNAVPEVVTEVAYDTYTWNDVEYTESGDYTYSHIDANGCAQVDTLHLTINHYDSIVVILTVNDANMGTTDPVAGTYSFYPGDVVTATATANTGYEFVGWVVSNSMFGSDTVSREASVTYEMLPMMQGMTVNVEAVFREKVGIETADYSNINIFSTDNKIYVNGAEGMTIYIYDVNGRCMARRANAADSETFTVETTGVVLVKAGNAPAKRVVLVR